VRDWVDALYIIVPAYCTNGAPIIFGGGPPIDRGKSLPDGQRIFGDHKTLGGFVAGLVVGSIVGIFGYYLFAKAILPLAILASLGALVGDLTGAFVKRRMGMKPGAPFPGLDQLDFVLGALLVVYPFYEISLVSVLIVLFVTPPIHLVMNICAYRLGLKSSFW
jgi:CDP-2,3-bis-(O-geranylgeranyl)-sn-glycerol synthase